MRVLGKIFGVLFAFVFVITSLLTLITFNTEIHLISADTYKAVLVEQEIYDRGPGIAMAKFIEDARAEAEPGSDEAKLFNAINPGEVAKALSIAVPAAELKNIVESLLDQIFAVADEKANSVAVSLASIKANIQKNGLAAAHSVMDSKPTCTATQMRNFDPTMMLVCQPPKAQAKATDEKLQAMLVEMTGELPDTYTLLPEESASERQEARDMTRLARTLMFWSPILPLLMLGLIAAVAVRSRKGWMRWWGIPLLIAGVLGIALSKITGAIVVTYAEDAMGTGEFGSFAQDVKEATLQWLDALSQTLLSPMFFQAMAMTVIGLVLVVGAILVPRAEKPIFAPGERIDNPVNAV